MSLPIAIWLTTPARLHVPRLVDADCWPAEGVASVARLWESESRVCGEGMWMHALDVRRRGVQPLVVRGAAGDAAPPPAPQGPAETCLCCAKLSPLTKV